MFYKVVLNMQFLLLLMLFNSPALAHSDNTLSLVTEPNPPYVTVDEDGLIGGITTHQLQAILEQAGIDYQISTMPWKRSLEQKHSMIYPLARISKREDDFHWVLHLHTVQIKIFGLKDRFDDKAIDVSSGNYRFVCGNASVLCAAIKSFGVPESSVTVLGKTDGQQMIQMLQKGRIDFITTTEEVFYRNLKDMTIDPGLFMPIGEHVYEIHAYLASGYKPDDELVKKLRTAKDRLSKKAP